VVPQQN
jgi:hypothetical protein